MTMQAYRLTPAGAPARLALLRAQASRETFPTSSRLNTWRDARHWTLANYESAYATLSQGCNGGNTVWCSHAGPFFRNERFADDIVSSLPRGWFTDGEECSETARGIVASLPHGRLVAGYMLTMNDERVYFGEVFDDEKEAAYAADEHARIIGEDESEHADRWHEADRLQTLIEEKEKDVTELREKHSRFADVPKLASERAQIREEAADIISDIRGLRSDLEAFKDVL